MLTDLDLGFSNKLYDIELKNLPDNFLQTKNFKLSLDILLLDSKRLPHDFGF